MENLKKVLKFISSMRFAIILLVILAAACSVGSLVTQNQTYAWYAARYSERTAALIVALHLDDAFHSWYFILISAFLCLNLLLCNVIRLPSLIKRTAKENTLRSRIGLWGAWVTHLGVLLLILGFSLGQMTHREYAAYGVPGQSMPIGDTGLVMTIDDFRIDLRADDTVEQYTSEITVYDIARSSEGRSASLSVNNPADLYGLRFYQNSTGWAATVNIKKGDEDLQEAVVCAGDYLVVADRPDLVIYFNAFYPDYVLVPGQGPATMSSKPVNPGYLYSVYYQGQMLGMNVLMSGEVLTIDDYSVRFSQPQSYTLIQIKKDSFTSLAFAGGILILLGLLLSFYVKPRKPEAKETEDASS
ncbi:MAG: cytochrome c biogenesis protein ResB [Spirochaetales bacterium]|nr:cytochrome c biogenesis protein ResB [Spirochaetales bacterium]